jgi:hypothetical protein
LKEANSLSIASSYPATPAFLFFIFFICSDKDKLERLGSALFEMADYSRQAKPKQSEKLALMAQELRRDDDQKMPLR